ncbi:hypothetical protein NQ314_005378 [Rhamnusium bicolor]|uniref:Uncharacterized protein n=1 Tax=Rhamnusium bicolor TaxID=1586634 RepID=A0AAV8ZHL2_9CUCU|nr:hypothetical protein NQ314_005378 [Rhamnusium bicolor]
MHTIEKLVGTIGIGRDFSNVSIQLGQTTVVDNVSVTIMFKGDGYDVTWETSSKSAIFKDCYDLNIGMVNWYGGPERQSQKWPIEKLNLSADNAYVVNRYDNFAVAERYWLNSRGAYIFVEDTVPLFVDQNNEEQGKLCLIAKSKEPYIYKKKGN